MNTCERGYVDVLKRIADEFVSIKLSDLTKLETKILNRTARALDWNIFRNEFDEIFFEKPEED